MKSLIAWYIRRFGGFWIDGGKVAIVSQDDFAWLDRRASVMKDMSAMLTRAQLAERENADLLKQLELVRHEVEDANRKLDNAQAYFDATLAAVTKIGAQQPESSIFIKATEASDGAPLASLRFNGSGYTVAPADIPGGRIIRSGDVLEIYGRVS